MTKERDQLYSKAEACINATDFKGAITIYKHLEETSEIHNKCSIMQKIALSYFKDNQFDEGLAYINPLVKKHAILDSEHFSELLLTAGFVHMKYIKDYHTAISLLSTFIEIRQQHGLRGLIYSHYYLAQSYMAIGKERIAKDYYKHYLDCFRTYLPEEYDRIPALDKAIKEDERIAKEAKEWAKERDKTWGTHQHAYNEKLNKLTKEYARSSK